MGEEGVCQKLNRLARNMTTGQMHPLSAEKRERW